MSPTDTTTAEVEMSAMLSPKVDRRAKQLLEQRRLTVYQWTDRVLAWLMAIQWLAAVAAAYWISPQAWAGTTSQTHPHVWAAILLGGAISSLPILLAVFKPGSVISRHVIASGQMLMSALLIHLSGGRIETHFHVFGSLAILAFYRDAKVLMTASTVVALDHLLRGFYWPESAFGILEAGSWRWMEHSAWVVFEVTFLLFACRQNQNEMRQDSYQRALLESTNERIESEVIRRTLEIEQGRQQLEQSLLELERKNRELDEFTYVASHDLQEPIRKLVSFSKLLKQDIGTTLNENAEKDLNFIVDAAQRMRSLIHDLLALSRAGRSAMKHDPVALEDCVEMATEALSMRIRETGATIQCDPLPMVVGDSTLLTQLYQNLIGNALKFISTDRTPQIRLTAKRKDQMWELAVIDNGIGIKSEYSVRIFSPFQRLHNRAEYEGTGIGLAICRKSVERHDGEIWVESVYGEGSQFLFTIPVSLEVEKCHTEQTECAKTLSYC